MTPEFKYRNLINRSVLVVESPELGVPLISDLAYDGGIKGILIPELFFDNNPNLLLHLMLINRTEFAAVHIPGVGYTSIADIRVEQVSKIPKSKSVIMRGFTVNTVSEVMFQAISSLGYAVIEKGNSSTLLKLLSEMA